MGKLKYVLITPARNEEACLENTIRSVISQTILPEKWVLVSDGSTDRTDEIVKQYMAPNPWIELVRMPEHRDRHFAAKAHCFNAGYRKVQGLDFDIIGNLDADLSFEKDYFEFLLEKFENDPRLGVAGTPFLEGSVSYDYRFTNIEHVSGACQLFRRECFKDIGGYIPIKGGGIDWIAVTTARMKGWKTRTFVEKTCRHHRKIGTGNTNTMLARFRHGRKDYYLGYHPLWEPLRALYQMKHKPYIVGGLLLMSGYLWALLRGQERPVSKELVEFHRREQMERLKWIFLKPVRFASRLFGTKSVSPEPERAEVAQPACVSTSLDPGGEHRSTRSDLGLRGKRAAVLLFHPYPVDPRPRRAAEAFVNEGMSVDVICLLEDEDPKRERINGVNVLRLPISRPGGSKLDYIYCYPVFILICFIILTIRSLTRRYDLVHVHNMPDVLVLSALIPKALGAKVILDLHDPMPELMMTIFGGDEADFKVRCLKLLEKWSIKLADSVVTVNIACKRIFAARSGRSEKISVVMNAPDEKIFRFQPSHAPHATRRDLVKPFVIMYHGSAVARNGLDLAVDALARVRQSVPTAELRIYTRRNRFSEGVMKSVRDRGLLGAVHSFGQKRAEDIAKAIKECDVGIIPNHRSIFAEINMPTRIFEYLALGKPVVAPRGKGILDYFDDDALSWFELGNAEDLARQIEYVFFHPEETVEIVKRGQQVYLNHAWSEERLKFLRLTAEILANRASRIES